MGLIKELKVPQRQPKKARLWLDVCKEMFD